MSSFTRAVAAAGCAMVAVCQMDAQVGDWMTIGNDAQRSFWSRNDPKISPGSMRKPGFELVWKVALKQLNSLTAPALIDFYIGYRGFRSLGFVGGSAGSLVGIDTDLARIEWEKKLSSGSRPAAGSAECPGGMTSNLARPTASGYPPVGGIRGLGRSNPAKSGVGEPFEGAVTLKERRNQAPPPPPPARSASGRRAAAAPNPFGRAPQYIHAISADGKFHSLYVSNGEAPKPPVNFLPPNAHAVGLLVIGRTAYAATVNGCGGVDNGVWSLELESGKVTQWKTGGPNIAGSAGFAMIPDGTLFAAAGSKLVALDPASLQPKASYEVQGRTFTTSPVVFAYKERDLIAVATSDGRIELLDAADLAKPLSESPAYSAANFAAGALASYEDAAGIRWVLAPAAGPAPNVKNGAVVAWKVVDRNGAPALDSGWISRDMTSPATPVIVNGAIFAVSRGGRGSSAVLYALDPVNGKELWSSGAAMTSLANQAGLSAGGAKVYVGTTDGTQYAFGFPMEH